MTEKDDILNSISLHELYGILEDIPIPVVLTETNHIIRYANQQAKKLGGFDNLQGLKCKETFCKDTDCLCPSDTYEPLEASKQYFHRKDGSAVSVIKKTYPMRFKNDYFFAHFFTDLTQHLTLEQQLNEIIREKTEAEERAKSESRKFEMLFDNINDALYLHDLDGNIIKVNKAACNRLDYTKDELQSMHITEISTLSPDSDIPEKVAKIMQEGVLLFESEGIRKDGTRIPVEVSTRIFEFEGKQLILSTTRDISARKEYDRKLLEAKELTEYNESELKTIFNKVPSVVFIFNDQSMVQRINNKGKEWFNLVDESYKNQRIGDIVSCVNTLNKSVKCGTGKNCNQCQLASAFHDIIENGTETNKKELQIELLKGEEISDHTVLLSTSVLRKNGNSMFIATLDDITDRKKMETELLLAKEKAELSEKLKTAFLNNISHEIRTPLNGLVGFLDFFEDDLDQFTLEERKNFVDIMRKSADRLVNTVTDLIEASKLDTGIVEFTKESFFLDKVLVAINNEQLKKYASQNTTFEFIMDTQLKNQLIETDESKLKRVLRSLLDNAFKFTAKGKVTFEVSRLGNELRFSVQDTGIGISKEDIGVIFNPFRQAHIHLNRAFDGSGLGLTIASKLVKYLGGELLVESEPDKGSIFWFTLSGVFAKQPAAPYRENDTFNMNNENMKGKTILVAEDDEINFLFLQAVLEKQKYRLIHAKNGKEAVDLFSSRNDIDLVIMDLKMPVMNGIDATLKIKEINHNIPVIAHSAYILNNEREQSMAAGCSDYIPKPVKRDELLKTIGKYLEAKI